MANYRCPIIRKNTFCPRLGQKFRKGLIILPEKRIPLWFRQLLYPSPQKSSIQSPLSTILHGNIKRFISETINAIDLFENPFPPLFTSIRCIWKENKKAHLRSVHIFSTYLTNIPLLISLTRYFSQHVVYS